MSRTSISFPKPASTPWSMRAVHGPGHAAGCAALLVENRRAGPDTSPVRLGGGLRGWARGGQSGGDAVQDTVQAELEALLPGVRVVRVDPRCHQPGDVRIAGRVLRPPVAALVLG